MSRRHVLIVPGHRNGGHTGGEHLITRECLLRVRAAERLARRRPDIIAVVFSGVGEPGYLSEADQMADAWQGPDVLLVRERDSIDTAFNAACGLLVAKHLEATHVTVVSSCWHLRIPLYYLPFRRHGIAIGFHGARDFRGFAGRILHEFRMSRRIPRARRDAYATAALVLTELPVLDADTKPVAVTVTG